MSDENTLHCNKCGTDTERKDIVVDPMTKMPRSPNDVPCPHCGETDWEGEE